MLHFWLVWAVIPCLGHAGPEGKARLHAHRASGLEQDADEMMISAAGQVMRREVKQDSDRHDETHQETHRRGRGEEVLSSTAEALPVKVEGCQDAATAQVIEGYYMPSGTTGDKTSYKKEASGGADEVWLYHYADADAATEGWWIGSNPSGRVHIYAFNPSQAETPPSSGWKAPWWGEVDNQLQIETLKTDELPSGVGAATEPTELPEATEAPEEAFSATEAPAEAPEEAFSATEAPAEAPEEAFSATEAPAEESSVVLTSERPAAQEEERSGEEPAVKAKAPKGPKDLKAAADRKVQELQHLLKEEGEMITAAVAKLSSGKKLADTVFGTDTATIPDEPPSDEMLDNLVKAPALAKKALNKTVSILQGAKNRLESGQVFANELLGTNTSKWLETAAGKGNKTWAEATKSTVPDQPAIEGSKAAPLLKSVDEVAIAASEAAEKARKWKDAEIAQLHAKEAAEEAKKKVEKLTVQAAKEEAEKAVEEAAGGEVEAAKEEASKLAARADAEVADKETQVAKAKKKLGDEDATEEEKKAAEEELEAAETEVKKATAKAKALDEKAGKLKLAKDKDDDNALYSGGEVAEPQTDSTGPIVLGSEPKTDLEDKLDILQSKLQGLQRVQMKDQLKDRLSASLAEGAASVGTADATQGEIRLLQSAPKDPEPPKEAPKEGEAEGEGEKVEEKKPKKKKTKGSWNRITVFVMIALGVCLLLGGAVYQLVTVRQMKRQSKKAEEKPLMEEQRDAGNPAGEEVPAEDPAPAGS